MQGVKLLHISNLQNMATSTKGFGDGTSDVITIDPSSGSLDGAIALAIPANNTAARQVNVRIVGTGVSKALEYTISQPSQVAVFVQPALTANGTLGGDSFAVAAQSSSNPAYEAFDNATGTFWSPAQGSFFPQWIEFYNPTAIKVSSLSIATQAGNTLKRYSILGSDDGTNWTTICTVSGTFSGSFTAAVNSTVYYKYHRFRMEQIRYYSYSIIELTINAVIRNS
jgi:hypothetical protein